MIRHLLAVSLAVFALLGFEPAHAHLTPDSRVTLELRPEQVEANIIIPASEYAYASGNPVTNDFESLRRAEEYLLNGAELRSSDGQIWLEEATTLRFTQTNGPRDLHATVVFRSTSGGTREDLRLRWTPVLAETADHFATILVDDGQLLGEPRIIGILRQGDLEVAVQPQNGGTWSRFFSAMELGIDHILGGIDHLAFLLALLLAAPLIARNGRWSEMKSGRKALRSLIVLATGFTAGHSATLIIVASTGTALPPVLVETMIAVTVLIAAVHAIRPIFPSRELVVTLVFGLIHGLGFAGFIQQTEAEVSRELVTLLGFNLGIEIIQIALLVLFVPALFILARLKLFDRTRLVLATMVCLAAIYWIVTRLGIFPAWVNQ